MKQETRVVRAKENAAFGKLPFTFYVILGTRRLLRFSISHARRFRQCLLPFKLITLHFSMNNHQLIGAPSKPYHSIAWQNTRKRWLRLPSPVRTNVSSGSLPEYEGPTSSLGVATSISSSSLRPRESTFLRRPELIDSGSESRSTLTILCLNCQMHRRLRRWRYYHYWRR